MPNELREEAIAHMLEEAADKGYKNGPIAGYDSVAYQVDESTWRSDVQGRDEDASANIVAALTSNGEVVARTVIGRAIAHFTGGKYDWCEFDEAD